MAKQPDREPARQSAVGSTFRSGIEQISDTPITEQTVTGSTADSLKQSIKSQQPTMQIGNWRATGLWAVIGLTLVVLIFLGLRYLS
jgi:hypothetical protein